MRLLLDTHVFLWYISADPQLPAAFHAAIQDPANEVFLSVASKSSRPKRIGFYLPARVEKHLDSQRDT